MRFPKLLSLPRILRLEHFATILVILDDEQLLLMKENGGVVQTVAFSAYTNTEKHEAFNKARQELLKKVGDEMGFERKDRSEI